MKKIINFLETNNKQLSSISKLTDENKIISDAKKSLPEFENGLKWLKIIDNNEDLIINSLKHYHSYIKDELRKNDLNDTEYDNLKKEKEKLEEIFNNI